MAYPMSKHDIESHAKNFRHYVGFRAGELATLTIIKVGEAQELEQAAHQLGFIPETSLPKPMASQFHPGKRTFEKKRNVVVLSTSNPVYAMSIHLSIRLFAHVLRQTLFS